MNARAKKHLNIHIDELLEGRVSATIEVDEINQTISNSLLIVVFSGKSVAAIKEGQTPPPETWKGADWPRFKETVYAALRAY